MREDHAKDMKMGEDIRHIPLYPGEREEKSPNKPVGSSHMGGKNQGKRGLAPAPPGRSRSRAKEGKGEKEGADAVSPSPRSRTKDVRKGVPFIGILLAVILGVGVGMGGGYYLWGWERPNTVDLKAVEMPDWVKQEFIRKNLFSRPDFSRQRVNKIVIHYVANPGSTAEGNRNFFDRLADQDPEKTGTSTSSHFVVGLEGEVIQCIPITEVAYANAPCNYDTISIEGCHPDKTGKFNDATYQSVVNLTAYLCRELKLTTKDVERHYDINGKICPKYFVDHEEAWIQFKKDVDEAMKSVG